MVTVKAGALADLVRDIFARAGCSEAEAGRISKYLVSANTGGAAPFRGSGMLSFYVDPKAVDPEAMFPADVARFVAFFKSARPAIPGGEVLLPGEPERRTRERRLMDGVPLPYDTGASIVAAAREVGVDERRMQEAGAGVRVPSPRASSAWGEGERRRT
jgi:LDH2 family malate/lactate/ureidoglycolate dehydrogenase